LAVMPIRPAHRAEFLGWIAAAQLHHEAVGGLAEATDKLVPALVRAGSDEVCDWYTLRALHRLMRAPWGALLVHVVVDCMQDGATAPPAGVDPDQAAADRLYDLIATRVREPWTRPPLKALVKAALAGNPKAPFCVALHGESRVAVVDRLRARLANAHFLLVNDADVDLPEADRARATVVAPHVRDEETLVLAY